MSRNYGLGSREMSKAGKFALQNAAKTNTLSYSSAGTISDRWSKFCNWAREQGIKKMEDLSDQTVKNYAKTLKNLAPSTAQNYLSAVNTVMKLATKGDWKPVSPTKDCGIEKQIHTRVKPVPGRDRIHSALDSISDEKMQAVAVLMVELGLRSKEAGLIDAKMALKEASGKAAVTISKGTKGGRWREIQITREEQLQALQNAAEAQGGQRSMIPEELSWKEFREGELRDLRENLQEHGIDRLHDLRAAFANQRFEELTGHASPLEGGSWSKTDHEAGLTLAEELGHGRLDILKSYLGK